MNWAATANNHEDRGEPRHEVFYRTSAVAADGSRIAIVIVNVSGGGLMARCIDTLNVGDRIDVQLPVLGSATAEIRWALGGRIGCQFDRPVPTHSYFPFLSALRGS
ncbi:PilZ domain-containing protein [Sphingomonas sp. NY01]|uniref:PilZ domain-containing protein n=1 Tax=Sphingomonas sp. NY01 TaxID=2968057 RepID=UPI00315DBCFB